jgi:hypothetical protein
MAEAGSKMDDEKKVACRQIQVCGFPQARVERVAEFLDMEVNLEAPVRSRKGNAAFDQTLPVDVIHASGDVDVLANYLESKPDISVLLVLDAPEAWIAVALHEGKELANACNDWLLAADACVRLADALPERVSVNVYQDIQRNPRKFVERLANNLELQWGIRGDLGEWEEKPVDPVLAVIAELSARRHRTISETWKRLQQHAVHERGAGLKLQQLDAEVALTRYRNLAGENRLMFEQLHRNQVELEKKIFDAQSAQSEAQDLRHALQSREAELEQLRRMNAACEGEILKLSSSCEGEILKLSSSCEAARKTVDRLELKLEQMRKSTSWKITGPMRVAIRAMRRMLGR